MKLFSDAYLKQYDPDQIFESVLRFSQQARQAVRDVNRLPFPRLLGKVDAIVVAGMGGSALGAHVLQAACSRELRVPLVIANDYHIPAWVGRRTLVVLSSYSGSTEETIAAAKAAKLAGAKVVAITSGGVIGRFARAHKLPAYMFTPIENPSGQPRLGTGYMTFGLLAILRKVGLLSLSAATIEDAIQTAHRVTKATDLRRPSPLLALSHRLMGRAILVVAAEHLLGTAHVMSNQLNETAKAFATWFAIPELNHHLMEGLENPKANIRRTTFLMLSSQMYHPRTQKRFQLTADVIRQNGAKVEVVRIPGKTRLDQAASTLAYSGALTLALGLRYRINPATIQWVHYFKRRLAK